MRGELGTRSLMPRTEVYQLRLTKSEKDELAEKARTEEVSIAKLIRWRCGLDTREEAIPVDPPDAVPGSPEAYPMAYPIPENIGVPPIQGTAQFKTLVAKHKLRHPTATAERMARKELGT